MVGYYILIQILFMVRIKQDYVNIIIVKKFVYKTFCDWPVSGRIMRIHVDLKKKKIVSQKKEKKRWFKNFHYGVTKRKFFRSWKI